MTRLTAAAALASLVLGTGCMTDGQNGDQGNVRFSQMVNFAETRDFQAPIAVARTVLLKLEHPSALTNVAQRAYPELTLDIQPVGHGGRADVFPLGFAEYGFVLRDEGDYRLRAMSKDTELDSLQVSGKKPDHVRLGAQATVVTTRRENGKSCSESSTQSVDSLSLHRNQELSVYVVPVDAQGDAMLGFLSLSAQGPSMLQLDAPFFMEGGAPNTLEVRPAQKLGSEADIEVRDAAGFTLNLHLATADDDATAGCTLN